MSDVFLSRIHVPEELASAEWPFDVPAVARLIGTPLVFERSVTFLVGANGTGKSTIVESIAEAYGIDVRGGHAGRRYASPLERGELGSILQLRLVGRHGTGRRGKGYFLRSETALGFFEAVAGKRSPDGELLYHEGLARMSHGESYLQVFADRFSEPGLYLLDEPESGLAFEAQLELLVVIDHIRSVGGQVICATHSPVLTAMPDADIFELTTDGIDKVEWEDLALVANWRDFMTAPQAFIRHLLPDQS